MSQKRKERSEENAPSQSASNEPSAQSVRTEVKDIFAGEFSYYNKYEDVSWSNDRDRFICLSTDLDSANKKTVSFTDMYREDIIGHDFDGTDSEPCRLQFLPRGGAYVLTVSTENITESFRKYEEQRLKWPGAPRSDCHFTKMIGRASVSEVIELLGEFGLGASVEAIPKKFLTAKSLAPAVTHLLRKDLAGARNFLAACKSGQPADILKDARFVVEDESWYYTETEYSEETLAEKIPVVTQDRHGNFVPTGEFTTFGDVIAQDEAAKASLKALREATKALGKA